MNNDMKIESYIHIFKGNPEFSTPEAIELSTVRRKNKI
jgi:hypothetical protein